MRFERAWPTRFLSRETPGRPSGRRAHRDAREALQGEALQAEVHHAAIEVGAG